MLLTPHRDAYVTMKAKAKGIDQKNVSRGPASADHGTPAPGDKGANGSKPPFDKAQRFNAFKEMDKLRKGGQPHFAKIPDTVAVIGTPPSFDREKKRNREADDEERPAKIAKPEVCCAWSQTALADCDMLDLHFGIQGRQAAVRSLHRAGRRQVSDSVRQGRCDQI